MRIIGKYKETDLMSDLICENYSMLLVMSRFGVPFGFGDQTIASVCKANNVHTPTFLAVVNMLIGDEREIPADYESLSAAALVDYLKKSHAYFLDFRLPAIRTKLVDALSCSGRDMSVLITRYYDEYVKEVNKHMAYEEYTVFPYVESVIGGKPADKYNIDVFSRKHDDIENRLSELKNIIIKYCPIRSSNELNGVLFDMFSCAQDLLSHTEIENDLFIPLIRRLELQKK